MKMKQEDSLNLLLNNKPKDPIKKIRYNLKSWFLNHPNFWVNPMSISSIFRATTGSLRILPDFLIIGAPKCGTTSMYEYLIQHPNILSSLWKEIYFFDRYFTRGTNWYRGNFAFKLQKKIHQIKKKIVLSGDATPTYLHHPLTAQRVHEIIPNAKIIVMLRNPIDRAYSHWKMEKRLGFEKLSFEEALKKENERLFDEENKMINNPKYFSWNRQIFSYMYGGLYYEHLKSWLNLFPHNQFLIINTEEMNNNTNKEFQKTLEFLNLPNFKLHNYEQFNSQQSTIMEKNTRSFLHDYFEPYNKKLFKLINKEFIWE